MGKAPDPATPPFKEYSSTFEMISQNFDLLMVDNTGAGWAEHMIQVLFKHLSDLFTLSWEKREERRIGGRRASTGWGLLSHAMGCNGDNVGSLVQQLLRTTALLVNLLWLTLSRSCRAFSKHDSPLQCTEAPFLDKASAPVSSAWLSSLDLFAPQGSPVQCG